MTKRAPIFRDANYRKFLEKSNLERSVIPKSPLTSVKGVIDCWEKGGVDAVKVFLAETKVYENTWISKIQNLIDQGHIKSVDEEIELVAFNIDLKNKLYTKNGDTKNS